MKKIPEFFIWKFSCFGGNILNIWGRVNKNQPYLFLGEIDLFFFEVIAL